MITVYAISSLSKSYIYVGLSSQLHLQILRHNKGQNKTTKPYAPFKVIYTKNFASRIDARAHEKFNLNNVYGNGRFCLSSFNY